MFSVDMLRKLILDQLNNILILVMSKLELQRIASHINDVYVLRRTYSTMLVVVKVVVSD